MLADALKHYAKMLLGRQDDKWPFLRMQQRIPDSTWALCDEMLRWSKHCLEDAAELESADRYAADEDPVVRQGGALAASLRKGFRGKYAAVSDLRILIHIPAAAVSPAGASLFGNLAEALAYLGIPVEILRWDQRIEEHLEQFRPTVFITSDNKPYLDRINWDALARYRQDNQLQLGLTASLEVDGNTPLAGRLTWARTHGVNFYYSFHASEYLDNHPAYAPFRDEGYRIITVEFGANPLLHYPVPGVVRDCDYIFMGSGNYSSYLDYFSEIITSHTGFLAGRGWLHSGWVPSTVHRYLYARAKVGLNIHGPLQLETPREITERTYILAACGVPQLVDNPKLLPLRFSPDSMFVASSPKEYALMFKEILASPQEAQLRTLKAQKEVFERHTTFHRAEGLIEKLLSCVKQDFIGQ